MRVIINFTLKIGLYIIKQNDIKKSERQKMSNIVIFNGSPHIKGTTAALLEAVADGAKSQGAEIVFYDLNDKNVK